MTPAISPRRRLLVAAAAIVAAGLVITAPPYAWVRWGAASHTFDVADAPTADVAMVLGTEVGPDRITPKPVLRGRLETAAELVRTGRAKVIIVSGDAGGQSGNEITSMIEFLVAHGVERGRIVGDGAGLDTYDSCARASQTFGVRRLLVVTQAYHLDRAVTLCRQLGIDADGVRAGCSDCSRWHLAVHTLRDYLASTKAAADAVRDRPPLVRSPPNPAVRDALSAHHP